MKTINIEVSHDLNSYLVEHILDEYFRYINLVIFGGVTIHDQVSANDIMLRSNFVKELNEVLFNGSTPYGPLADFKIVVQGFLKEHGITKLEELNSALFILFKIQILSRTL